MVINFELPGSSLHPVAQFSAAAECFIDEGGMNGIDRCTVPEPELGGTLNQFLPQGAAASRNRVALELKGSLKTDRKKQVAEHLGETRGRNENFHCAAFSRNDTCRAVSPDSENFNFIYLTGKAAADKSLNLEADVNSLRRSIDGGHGVGELPSLIVMSDLYRTMQVVS